MYSEERVPFVVRNELVPGEKDVRRRKWRHWIGEKLAYFVEPVIRDHENRRLHMIQWSRADNNGARLSQAQFLELQDFQETAMDIEGRRKHFYKGDHSKTMHGIVPPLIETILKFDPSIRSVLDIGCNFAYMDHVMAKRFPHVQFYGVDVPRELEKINEELKLPNLKVRSGYALDLIERGELHADLCYFSTTAITIRTPELKAYLAEIAKFAKYVVFSESIYESPDKVSENPDTIDPDLSIPTFLQIHFPTNKRGYLCYVHNYRALVTQAGFDVFHYRVFIPSFVVQHWVLLAGRNRNSALWGSEPIPLLPNPPTTS